MTILRAPKKPINQPVVFYATLADIRRQQATDPTLYLELFHCPADGQLADALTGYVADDGVVYCDRNCAYEAEVMATVTAEEI
jgi:hypothetical protein